MAIKVYYHIHCTGDTYADLFLVDEQLKALQWSKLLYSAEVNCVITGDNSWGLHDLVIRTLGKDRLRCVNILERTDTDHEELYEGRTLQYLWRDAQPDDYICYIHTKGISYLTGQRKVNGVFNARHIKAINGWRLKMEQKILTEWPQRIAAMPGCDTQGCYFKQDPFWHYMGNFWWAKGSHILKLPNPITHDPLPYPGSEFEETKPARMKYEQWLFRKEGYHLNLEPYMDWPKKQLGYADSFNPYEDDVSEP
jgi:hypothetical protein